jgi:predicted kinase
LLRIDQGKLLLIKTEWPVAHIAEQVAFKTHRISRCVSGRKQGFRRCVFASYIPIREEGIKIMEQKSASCDVYILSGPCGAGKSTTARELANQIAAGVLIEGDVIHAMLQRNVDLTWEERLALSWMNLLSLTRNFVQKKLNVVIDYVVEDELDWFVDQLSDMNVQIRYAVLTAEEEVLKNRLIGRGNPELIDRSMVLLYQLKTSTQNQLYLYDTSSMLTSEIVEELIHWPLLEQK